MTSLIYNTGTVTVSNGSAAVTGNLTGWAVALVTGGIFSVDGMAVPILSVEDDTHLTLAYSWPGTSGAGLTYAIARQPSEATARAATWTVDRLARLAQTPWGVGVVPDGRGTLAERDAVTPLPNDDYCWLRVEVDQPAELYFRDGGVWLGPYVFEGTEGPPGPPGSGLAPMGSWSATTTYNVGQYVTYSGRAFASLVDDNLNQQPPATPTDSAYWMYVPSAGGDFVGPGASATDEVVLFSGATGKIGKRGPLLNIAPRVPLATAGADDVSDFDTFTSPGHAGVVINVNNAHGPVGIGAPYVWLDVYSYNNSTLMQEARPYRTAGPPYVIARRVRYNGVWGAWDYSPTSTQGAKADTALQPAAIGTTVQGYAALLAAIAGLIAADGQFLAFAGADAPAVRDIVGTVSQSGGVPTGAIVEGGSNANGTYVRYADGTQICIGTMNEQTTDAVFVTGLYFNTAPSSGTFPAAFSAIPQVVANAIRSDGAGGIRMTGCIVTGTTTTSTGGFRSVSSASTHKTTHTYIAIGRWF